MRKKNGFLRAKILPSLLILVFLFTTGGGLINTVPAAASPGTQAVADSGQASGSGAALPGSQPVTASPVQKVEGAALHDIELPGGSALPSLTVATTAPASTNVTPAFTDVPQNDPNFLYIKYLSNRHLVAGYPDGTFHPDSGLTRAEAATLLVKVAALKPVSGRTPFSDVSPGYWASGNIAAASVAGLVYGYPNGTFHPRAVLTRAEGAALFTNLIKQPNQATLPSPNDFLTRSDLASMLGVILTENPDYDQATLTGTLKPLTGTVQITASGTTAPTTITATTPIAEGDTITTGANSSAEIDFPDGSSLLIKENSVLTVKKMQGKSRLKADGTAGTAIAWLELGMTQGQMFGALASTYEKPAAKPISLHGLRQAINLADDETNTSTSLPWYQASAGEQVQVQVDMPWGVAGIEGTIWQITITLQGTTVSTADGHVQVTSNSGQSVQVTAGFQASLTSSNAAPTAPITMTSPEFDSWQAVQDWVQQTAAAIQAQIDPASTTVADAIVNAVTSAENGMTPPPVPAPTIPSSTPSNSVAPDTDDTLSALEVNGTPVASFAPATLAYNVTLPAGTTTVPTVSATVNDPKASEAITQAASVTGSATVLVTAQDPAVSQSYIINFSVAPDTDDTLSALEVNGTPAASFAPATLAYNVTLPAGTTTLPVVTATTNDTNATAVITQAASVTGSATVLVTAQDPAVSQSYTINFSVADTTPAPVQNSSISPTTATFDLNTAGADYTDLPVTLTLNGNTLVDVKNGGATLTQNSDYTVSGSTVTILKSYLATQSVGTTTLTFDFSAGDSSTLAVTVEDILVNFDAGTYSIGNAVTITVDDSGQQTQTVTARVRSSVTDPQGVSVTLTEAGPGVYTGYILIGSASIPNAVPPTLGAGPGETITGVYVDSNNQTRNCSAQIASLTSDSARFVLTWGATPYDLDSHLDVCDASGRLLSEVFYAHKRYNTATLDLDVTAGYGPETVTISALNPNYIYRYWVHNYSNYWSTSNELANSSAKVLVYLGGNLTQTYTVLQGNGSTWSVFELNGATKQITDSNYITDLDETLNFTGGSLPDATEGASYNSGAITSYVYASSNSGAGTGYIYYDVSGLPNGLSFDPGTNEITGTPVSGDASSSPYTLSFTVQDGVADTLATCSLPLHVNVVGAQNSTISPTTATFDLNVSDAVYNTDVVVNMTLNGNTLVDVKNGGATLTQDTDYTVSGGAVTILKSYLATQSVGTTTLTFDFSAGTAQTLAISVIDIMATANSYSFDTGNGGWKVISLPDNGPYDSGHIISGPLDAPFESSGGNPDGFIESNDLDGNTNYWQAPPAFVSAVQNSYGGTLGFDIDVLTSGGWWENDADLVLCGQGMTLVYDLPEPTPINVWYHQTVSLNELAGWKKDSPNGQPPTKQEFQNMLNTLNDVFIRAEFVYGADTEGLDNVTVTTALQNSSISPTTDIFDLNVADSVYNTDLPVTLTLNGNGFVNVKNGASILNSGTDYTVSGNTVTILKNNYLATQGVGTTMLTFDFSAGSPATLAVTVEDTTTVPATTITSINAVNGTLTVTLSAPPNGGGNVSDFTVTQSIDGAAAITINPSINTGYTSGDVVTLNVPQVAPTASDQSVIDNVSYLGGAAVAAPFTVPAITSTDDTLSNLTVDQGTLTPVFAVSTLNYTDSVTGSVYGSVYSITVTPTADESHASITVNGSGVVSGQPQTIDLSVGFNPITIVVTAQDGITKKTYQLIVEA